MYHLSMEVSDYYSGKDHFIVEDLFNFSNDDPALDAAEDNGAFDAVNGSSTDSSAVAAGNGYGSSVSGYGQHFSSTTDFSQPCEEVAELEWLSNFVEDCFSNKDYHKPHQFSNMSLKSSSSEKTSTQSAQFTTVSSTVPAKTRSKRSRANPSNWASRLPILSPTPTPTPTPSSSSSDSGPKPQSLMIEASDGVRRCLHCGSDTTPQWRMGPMGPKTLCNACGVRYKSGRLVPEYRPAASPTFVVSEHSNSHRKVVELRRQKELQQQQQQQQQQMLFWS